MYKFILAIILIFGFANAANVNASDKQTYTIKYSKGTFEDVFQDVQDAIINKGFVIDYTGHVDRMLERTAKVASDGSKENSPYLKAKYLQFCSAALTHEFVRIKPQNLAICPFVIFVYQTKEVANRVAVGFRNPELENSGPTYVVMKRARKLLDDILAEATSQ